MIRVPRVRVQKERKEWHVIRDLRESDPCYIMAEYVAELCFFPMCVGGEELYVSNEIGYLIEI